MIFNTSASSASGSLPRGAIVLWSGATNTIPEGWHICDGTNGTPNLKGKFVLGTGNGYNIGSVGGEINHVLTISEMPSHTHAMQLIFNTGTHPTNVSFDSGSQPEGTLWTDSAGGSAPHNNMPPYYVLAYIMKL